MDNLQIQYIDTDILRPYPNNAKRHKVAWIQKSIERFDFDQPIVVDKDMVIIKGHGRWEAAKKIGLGMVPVIIRDDLTEDQARLSRLADNRAQMGGGFDAQMVLEEIDGLDLSQIEDIGFNDAFLNKLGKKDTEFDFEDDFEGGEDDNFKPGKGQNKFALSIVLEKEQFLKWEAYKKSVGKKSDLSAFLFLLGEVC